jgi:hypothetical protein
MKKIIWVGMNKNGGTYVFTGAKPIAKNGGLHGNWYGGAWYSDLFDLELKPLEIVEIIIDTETQSYEIKREREIGWYLVECKSVEDDGLTFACHWNGKNWTPVRNKKKWRTGVIWEGLNEDEVTVISDKLPYNEYLQSLE